MNNVTKSGGRLDGKVGVITGATGGIGEATAKLFLEEGGKVMLVGRSEDKLAATRERLSFSDNVAWCAADAADEKATADAVAKTVDRFGGLDIMFANAGTEGEVHNIEDLRLEDFESVLRTNVIGVWLSMKHCIEPMKKRGGGSIIATSSIAGVIGFPGMAPYIASKHAVYGIIKTAALEFADSGIRANAIAPGPIANRMMSSIEGKLNPEDAAGMHEALRQMVPMKRYGTNEEVARLALFLASDESSFCTGAIYLVDGGFVAG